MYVPKVGEICWCMGGSYPRSKFLAQIMYLSDSVVVGRSSQELDWSTSRSMLTFQENIEKTPEQIQLDILLKQISELNTQATKLQEIINVKA